MALEERVVAQGHENVRAEHESTFEFTTDDFLTPAGDCILGIEADRTPSEFDSEFVAACADDSATIKATLTVDGHTETITGSGHSELSFEDTRSLVGRTSSYVDDRTIMVEADKAAADLDRELIDALAAGAEVTMRLVVSDED